MCPPPLLTTQFNEAIDSFPLTSTEQFDVIWFWLGHYQPIEDEL